MEFGLSLGSNLDDRLDNLRQARGRIAAIPGVTVLCASPVYETSPVDVPVEFEGLPFLNAVLVIETGLAPPELLHELNWIESIMGRSRGDARNSPRIIDIDIIYAGDIACNSGGMSLPHPHWAQRKFVVRPLADLRPDLVLPGQAEPVSRLLSALPDDQKVVPYAAGWEAKP